MKMSYRTVAKVERGYSIATFPGTEVNGEPAFVAGSEGRGELLFFEPPDYRPQVIAREPGGFISVAPLTWNNRRYVVASTQFYPFFEAAESVIRVYPLDGGECPGCVDIGALPYTHRIAIHTEGGKAWLLASTLCSGKKDRDDWTQPGGIHLFTVPGDLESEWPERKIVSGLNKNHGMDAAVLGPERRNGYLLSAMEGLLFLTPPRQPDGEWDVETLNPKEHSDAYACDWTNQGETEIFTISPFHGNVLTRYRKNGKGWVGTDIDDDLSMGHIVWAGSFLGEPGLLAGSRRDDKEWRLYRNDSSSPSGLKYTVLEKDIGPTQIEVVTPSDDRAVIFMAAHGVNEIRVYTMER